MFAYFTGKCVGICNQLFDSTGLLKWSFSMTF